MSRESAQDHPFEPGPEHPHLPEPRRQGRRKGLLPAVSVAVAACLAAAAVPASAAGPDPVVSRGVTIPAFYNPPTQLPAADGSLVRTEPLPLGVSLPGLDGRPMPGTATRLMYKSTDAGGGPVAVTGAYIEPSAAWKGGGARPWWRWPRGPWARATSAPPRCRSSTR